MALPKLGKSDKGHFPAPTDPDAVGEILRTLDSYHGGEFVKAALRLAPMLAVRPGELRQMQWCDIDLEAAEWRFFVTKTKVDHIVPLSQQAVAILRLLQGYVGGEGRYVFWSDRCGDGSRCLSDAALVRALRSMGIRADELVIHDGWRATFRTMGDEVRLPG